ncbi:MAG: tRNA pseudouridine(38-40) synthase TruA [Lachnospiraceae bacterium]|nr:tRNA pseudouridine(38-40) synthase TruA [Lachnospiraceae bacterium]
MVRILLCVSYDGTGYCGWQFQKEHRTVEGELNKAIAALTGEEVEVIGASRTDAGVHALCNMAVFDTDSTIPGDRFSYALNTKLPDDIRIVWSREVPSDFHPRHVATEKTYQYHIFTGEFMPPTKRLYAVHESRPLDIEAMRTAAAYLIGEHDFKSFCSADTSAVTTVRNVKNIEITRDSNELTVSVKGNGFLYNMVRIIVGTLLWVGLKVRTPEEVKEILEACDRTKAGPTMPPQGLMLADFKFLE